MKPAASGLLQSFACSILVASACMLFSGCDYGKKESSEEIIKVERIEVTDESYSDSAVGDPATDEQSTQTPENTDP